MSVPGLAISVIRRGVIDRDKLPRKKLHQSENIDPL